MQAIALNRINKVCPLRASLAGWGAWPSNPWLRASLSFFGRQNGLWSRTALEQNGFGAEQADFANGFFQLQWRWWRQRLAIPCLWLTSLGDDFSKQHEPPLSIIHPIQSFALLVQFYSHLHFFRPL